MMLRKQRIEKWAEDKRKELISMNQLLKKARQMLEKNIIPFWQNLRDDYYGGYIGHVDFSMQLDIKAEKGCI